MNFKVFLEIFGSFNYEVPDDKEQQLFDFYMLNNLAGRSAMDDRRQKAFNKTGYDIGTKTFSPDHGDMSEDDKINYMIDEIKEKLLPELKKNLLDAVFYSISAELRHGVNQNTYVSVSRLLKPDELEIFKKYAKSLVLFQSPVVSPFARTPAVNQEMLGQNKDRNASFYAATKVGDRVGFVKMAKNLFFNAYWHSSYGGPAWGDIAQSWLDLYKAKKYSELFVQIDHIYDLQHNTGTVLNKVDNYAKEGSFEWLSNALNFKANIKDPHEIVDHISPRMKKFAIRAIKNKTGKSWEQFEKERGEKSRLKKQVDQITQPALMQSDRYKDEKKLIKDSDGKMESLVAIAMRLVTEHFFSQENALAHALKAADAAGFTYDIYHKKHMIKTLEMHVKNAKILETHLQWDNISTIKTATVNSAKNLLSMIKSKGFESTYPYKMQKAWSALNKTPKEAYNHLHNTTNMPKNYCELLVLYYTLQDKVENNTNASKDNTEQLNSNQKEIKNIFAKNSLFEDAAAAALMYLNPTLDKVVDASVKSNFDILLDTFKDDATKLGSLKYSKMKILKRFYSHIKNYNILNKAMFNVASPDILDMPFEEIYNLYKKINMEGLNPPIHLSKLNYFTTKNPIPIIKELRFATGYRLIYAKLLAMYFTMVERIKAEKAQHQGIAKPTGNLNTT